MTVNLRYNCSSIKKKYIYIPKADGYCDCLAMVWWFSRLVLRDVDETALGTGH